jgi:Na+/H+ antiporter NhaD/arsenite permease-like protein
MTIAIIIVFALGYLAIILENPLKINKAAPALVAGVLCWVILAWFGGNAAETLGKLHRSIGETAGILFFLLGAMTIVELIESHRGFDIVTGLIRTGDKKKLLWIVGIMTFFLSAILDNLTTAIVMVMLLQKLVCGKEDRFLFAGIVVIAANAGGAWSPIGDVTTTMLWISERVSALGPVRSLFLPSLVNLIVPLIIATLLMKDNKDQTIACKTLLTDNIKPFEKKIVFFSGIGVLVAVPVFKTLTHLPPYMGILIGLGVLWFITEILHKKKHEDERMNLSVLKALRKMDMSTLLFFLGILLAVASLEAAGILTALADMAGRAFPSVTALTGVIGLFSAVIDNVPLVAASMGMYPLSVYPADHSFWMLLAYCAGTGGSLLIIGSAAGVAAMAIEKIEFFKYLKIISWMALVGYLAGIGVYTLQGLFIK